MQRLIKSGRLQAKLKVSHPSDPYEQEADKVADQIVNSSSSTHSSNYYKWDSSEVINRKCNSCEMEKKLKRKRGKILL